VNSQKVYQEKYFGRQHIPLVVSFAKNTKLLRFVLDEILNRQRSGAFSGFVGGIRGLYNVNKGLYRIVIMKEDDKYEMGNLNLV
jgi:hypothetical protein